MCETFCTLSPGWAGAENNSFFPDVLCAGLRLRPGMTPCPVSGLRLRLGMNLAIVLGLRLRPGARAWSPARRGGRGQGLAQPLVPYNPLPRVGTALLVGLHDCTGRPPASSLPRGIWQRPPAVPASPERASERRRSCRPYGRRSPPRHAALAPVRRDAGHGQACRVGVAEGQAKIDPLLANCLYADGGED